MSQRPTLEDRAERIDQVIYLLCMGYRRSGIHEVLMSKHGCTSRTVDNYLAEARKLLAEQSGEPRHVHVGMALEIYRTVLRDKQASNKDRIAAQHRIDRLLGLEAPRRLEHAGTDGGPIKVDGQSAASIILSSPELHARAAALAVDAARELSEN